MSFGQRWHGRGAECERLRMERAAVAMEAAPLNRGALRRPQLAVLDAAAKQDAANTSSSCG
jgi:hypothetical protein